jgi:hypothetical protein
MRGVCSGLGSVGRLGAGRSVQGRPALSLLAPSRLLPAPEVPLGLLTGQRLDCNRRGLRQPALALANELARNLGVPASALTNLLQGRNEAMKSTLERLAKAPGVAPEALIADEAAP